MRSALNPLFPGRKRKIDAVRTAGKMVGIAHITRGVPANGLAAETLSLAFEACPNAIVMTDGACRIVLVNAETERLFGYARAVIRLHLEIAFGVVSAEIIENEHQLACRHQAVLRQRHEQFLMAAQV